MNSPNTTSHPAPPSEPTSPKTVLVLNHFARGLGDPGGSRHIELFSRLDGWTGRVISSNRTIQGAQRTQPEGILETVWVSPPAAGGPARLANWSSYCVTAFAKGLRTKHLDVVYGSSPHLLAPLAAWAIARLRRVPFILEIRDVWPKVLSDMGAMSERSLAYRFLEQIERFEYRRADRIVILAEGVRDHLTTRGVRDEDIVFIPNGADTADFTPTATRDELRARYGFSGVTAVYTGAHGPANGLGLLIEAAEELRERLPDLRIVLVGDGVEKRRLVDRAATAGLANLTFMDPVPKSEIRDILAAADIGVHCLADVDLFRTGVSPNKLFDYMAAGLPVLTNTPGEVADFVNESGGGLAVSPADLAAGLESLAILTAEERRALGVLGQAHLAATRSRTIMAHRVAELLTEVEAEPSRSRRAPE